MISMNQVWDDSVAFIRREAALLIPLTLATVYLSDVLASIASGLAEPGKPNPSGTILMLAAALWSIVGQLAIAMLVLRPGHSVGEALSNGFRRLGKVVLVAVLIGLIVSVAATPIATAAVFNGADPAKPETIQALPGWILLCATALIVGLIWLAVRLALINPLIVDRNPGVVEAIKTGFALTKGISARLFFVALLYGVMLTILSRAVQFVAGSIFALIGAAIDSPLAGTVMTAMVTGLITAAMSLLATVFLATLYRHVAGTSAGTML